MLLGNPNETLSQGRGSRPLKFFLEGLLSYILGKKISLC